jgi:hypothetical protein
MSAAEKLKEMHKDASAYIIQDERGPQAVYAANHFVDVMVECAPELIAVVKAAEYVRYVTEPFGGDYVEGAEIAAALSALDAKLGET